MSITAIPHKPVVLEAPPFIFSSSRLEALDNLRSFIIVLVVVFHAAMSYMLFAPTWWYVVDTRQSLGFFCFVMIADVFIMPVMFLLAGYFGLPSLLRKGEDGFAREKLKRVGIPWVVGTLFFAPATTYFIWLSRTKTPPPYLHFWTHTFFSTYFEQAQFWFLGVLLLFYFGLIIARSANEQLKWFEPGTGRPSPCFFPAFVAVTSVALLIVNQHVNDYAWVPVSYLLVIQPTRFSLYIFFFALGVHGYRRRWFTANGYNPRISTWLPLSLVLGTAFMLYKLAFGLKLDQFRYRAGNDVLHCAFCLTAVFALVAVFQKCLNRSSKVWRAVSRNSYAIYCVHMVIVPPLALLIRPLPWNIVTKFAATSASALMVSYLVSEFAVSKTPPFSTGNRVRQGQA
ncbi:MAG TPA: acyltransferase family protein [Terriglobales bacterium]|jgi:peptidoglycan/LPS O-acetylase OafA/YrhL